MQKLGFVRYSIAIILFFLCLFPYPAYASYVLPYPSVMPGNRLYEIMEFLTDIKLRMAFGTLATLKLHMHVSDKKIIEAKTLFEYNQYKLALAALEHSDDHIHRVVPLLREAKIEGPDLISHI